MSNETESASQKHDIGEFIAQSKQNADALKTLRNEFQEGLSRLGDRIERIADRTKLNFTPLFAFAAILLTVIGMVATPIGFFVWTSIQDNRSLTHELDAKLQREFTLALETATSKAEGINQQSRERHEEVMSRVVQLENWSNSRTNSDLEELRQRRMRDGGPIRE